MAIQNFLSGGFYGKLGQVVGQRWKNKRTLRTYVIPHDPKTPLQVEQRNKFAQAVIYSQSALMSNYNSNWFKSDSMSAWNVRMSTARELIKKFSTFLARLPLIPEDTEPPFPITQIKATQDELTKDVSFIINSNIPKGVRRISIYATNAPNTQNPDDVLLLQAENTLARWKRFIVPNVQGFTFDENTHLRIVSNDDTHSEESGMVSNEVINNENVTENYPFDTTFEEITIRQNFIYFWFNQRGSTNNKACNFQGMDIIRNGVKERVEPQGEFFDSIASYGGQMVLCLQNSLGTYGKDWTVDDTCNIYFSVIRCNDPDDEVTYESLNVAAPMTNIYVDETEYFEDGVESVSVYAGGIAFTLKQTVPDGGQRFTSCSGSFTYKENGTLKTHNFTSAESRVYTDVDNQIVIAVDFDVLDTYSFDSACSFNPLDIWVEKSDGTRLNRDNDNMRLANITVYSTVIDLAKLTPSVVCSGANASLLWFNTIDATIYTQTSVGEYEDINYYLGATKKTQATATMNVSIISNRSLSYGCRVNDSSAQFFDDCGFTLKNVRSVLNYANTFGIYESIVKCDSYTGYGTEPHVKEFDTAIDKIQTCADGIFIKFMQIGTDYMTYPTSLSGNLQYKKNGVLQSLNLANESIRVFSNGVGGIMLYVAKDWYQDMTVDATCLLTIDSLEVINTTGQIIKKDNVSVNLKSPSSMGYAFEVDSSNLRAKIDGGNVVLIVDMPTSTSINTTTSHCKLTEMTYKNNGTPYTVNDVEDFAVEASDSTVVFVASGKVPPTAETSTSDTYEVEEIELLSTLKLYNSYNYYKGIGSNVQGYCLNS